MVLSLLVRWKKRSASRWSASAGMSFSPPGGSLPCSIPPVSGGRNTFPPYPMRKPWCGRWRPRRASRSRLSKRTSARPCARMWRWRLGSQHAKHACSSALWARWTPPCALAISSCRNLPSVATAQAAICFPARSRKTIPSGCGHTRTQRLTRGSSEPRNALRGRGRGLPCGAQLQH